MSAVGIHVTLGEVAASLALVAIAIAASVWRRTDLESEIGIAVVRSAVQLIAVGYVIQAIFDEDSLALVFALIAVMVIFGAFTARGRARAVPGAFWPLLIGSQSPARPPWRWWSPSESSSRRPATSCRSRGW